MVIMMLWTMIVMTIIRMFTITMLNQTKTYRGQGARENKQRGLRRQGQGWLRVRRHRTRRWRSAWPRPCRALVLSWSWSKCPRWRWWGWRRRWGGWGGRPSGRSIEPWRGQRRQRRPPEYHCYDHQGGDGHLRAGNHLWCKLSVKMLAGKMGDKTQEVETGSLHCAFTHLCWLVVICMIVRGGDAQTLFFVHYLLHWVKLGVVNIALVHIGNIHPRNTCKEVARCFGEVNPDWVWQLISDWTGNLWGHTKEEY